MDLPYFIGARNPLAITTVGEHGGATFLDLFVQLASDGHLQRTKQSVRLAVDHVPELPHVLERALQRPAEV